MIKETELEYTAEYKLFNFRPVFFFAVFLCLGIYFAYLCDCHGFLPWFCAFLPVMLCLSFFFCRTKKRFVSTLAAVGSLLVAFAVGSGAYLTQTAAYKDCGKYHGERTVTVYGTVRSINENACILDGLIIDGNAENGQLVAYLPGMFAEEVRVLDEVVLRGYVRTATDYFQDGTMYASVIQQGRRFILSDWTCQKIGRKWELFPEIRLHIENVLYKHMDKTSAAVTLAVLTGNTDGMEAGLLQNMRYGGIAHVFAVSGLHIGAMYAFCLFIGKKIKIHRAPKWLRFALTAGVLLFYGAICGFSASVIRATTMCLVLHFSRLWLTYTDPLETLGFAAIIVLAVSPVSLFSVGFQLSFAACLGIILFGRTFARGCNRAYTHVKAKVRQNRGKPPVDERAHPPSVGDRIFRSASGFFSASLAAQIFTAPILLAAFGYISVWSLLLNCVFVPLIGAAFSVLLVFVALACIFPFMGGIILYLPSVAWAVLLLCFQTLDFSQACLTGICFWDGAFTLYYLGCSFLTDKWNIPKGYKNVFAAVCFLTFVLGTCIATFWR